MKRISVVIPTLNERDSILPLLRRLRPLRAEVIVVDDSSPDGTGLLVQEYARRARGVRLLSREGRTGLSSAVLEGFDLARGSILVCMDGDLSHPPELIPALVAQIRNGAEVAVGSRRVAGGGTDQWPLHRKLTSDAATLLARTLLRTRLKDPLSGFFAVDAAFYRGVRPRLDPRGYKILLELVVRGRPQRAEEVPFTFRNRQAGHSKLSPLVAAQYLQMVWGLRRGVR
ncbi:MAG: polyprenol monophosphomannose synthase [Candidatus Aenigmarchaeota archaeon]|nr:polyprenol monophosphomannose synthase [Candidatus Aenigmarchaeota archaeon]